MKRILLLIICAFTLSSSAHSVYYRTIDNLDITVTDEYKVEVYKEGKHMFSFDCSKHLMCRIHTTTSEDPQYKASDGRVTSSDDLKPLTIQNIEATQSYNTALSPKIRFFVTLSSATAASGEFTLYTIDTKTGGVQVNKDEWNWFRYGMPKPEEDDSCTSIAYC